MSTSVLQVRRSDLSDGEGWHGLTLDVAGTAKPGLRMEVAAGRRLLLQQADRPLMAARVDRLPGYVAFRRATAYRPVVAPVRADHARRIEQSPPAIRALRWSHYFARQLAQTHNGPLYSGRWLLTPSATRLRQVYGARTVQARWLQLLETSADGELDWVVHNSSGQVLCLRPFFSVDAPRVKAYRRQLREGVLAPILLWWVSGLDSYLLLDGHDRLAAYLAEGVEPSLLVLTALAHEDDARLWAKSALRQHDERVGHIAAEIERGTLGAAEALSGEHRALGAAMQSIGEVAGLTRAWPIRGGVPAWRRSVAQIDPQWLATVDRDPPPTARGRRRRHLAWARYGA